MADEYGINTVEDNFLPPQVENEPSPKAIDEMAGYYTVFTNQNEANLLTDFERNMYDFQNGNYPKLTPILDSILQEKTQAERQVIEEEIIPDETLTIDDKISIVQAAETTRPEVDPQEEMRFKLINDWLDASVDEHQYENRLQMIKEGYGALETREERKRKETELLNEIPLDAKKIIGGLALQINPFTSIPESHFPIVKAVRETIEGSNPISPGQALRVFKKVHNNLPETEKYEVAKKLFDNLKKYTSTFGYNEWEHYYKMQLALEPNQQGPDYNTYFEDAAAIIDSTILGGLATRFAMMGKNLFKANSVARTLLKASPAKFAAATGRIIAGGEEAKLIQRAMGMDATDAIISGAPRIAGEVAETNADAYRVALAYQRAEDIIKSLDDTGAVWLKEDKAAAAERILSEAEEEGFNIAHTNFKMEEGRVGFTVTGFWGKNASHGFTNEGAARASATSLGIENPKLEKINGEWFIEKNKFYPYKYEDAVANVDGDVLIGGSKAKWIADDLAKLDQRLAKMFMISMGKEHYVATKLQKSLKPVRKLRTTKSRAKVSEVLELGNKYVNDDGSIGKVFTEDELIARGLNKKEVNAYKAFRDTEDMLYAINDNRYRQRLMSEGMVQVKNGEYVTVAKPLKKFDNLFDKSDTVRVYDPKAKSTVSLTRGELIKLYEEGNQIGKYKISEFLDDVEHEYILLKKTDRTQISDLPPFILNYRKGYITRFYKDRWFVKRYKNGKVVETMDVAATRGKANRLAERYSEKFADTEFRVEYDESSLRNLFDTSESERLMYGTGQLFFSKRKDLPLGQFLDHEAAIEDPIDSIAKAIGRVSRSAAWEPTMNKLRRNWINTYGDMTEGKFPRSAETIISHADPVAGRRERAVSLFEHMHLMSSTQDPEQIYWKRMFMKAARAIEGESVGGGRTKLAETLDNIGDLSPFGIMKSASFIRLLGGFPTRQLVLQSLQPVMLSFLEPKYMAWRFWNDHLTITTGLMLIDKPDALKTWAKGAAAITGRTAEEIELMVDAYHKSGISQSIIGGHAQRAGMVQEWSRVRADTLLKKGQKYLQNALVAPLKLGGWGFNIGEYNNVTANWLIALQNRARKTGKTTLEILKDQNLLDDVHYYARGFGLNMSTSGQLRWQRGYLSLGMQYQAINFKSTLLLLGKNQALQGADAWKVRAALLAAYGAEGWGLGKATYLLDRIYSDYVEEQKKAGKWEYGPEYDVLPTWFKQGASGGLANFLPYFFMGIKVDASQSISMASGAAGENSWGTLAYELFKGHKSAIDILGGAPLQTAKEGYGTISTIYSMMQTHDWTDPNTPKELALALGNFFPQLSKYSQAQIAYNTGYWQSKNGDPIVAASMSEMILKSTLGINPSGVNDYYDIKFDDVKRKQALNEDIKYYENYIENQLKIHQLGSKELLDLERERLNIMLEQVFKVIDAHGSEDADYIKERLIERAWEKGKLNQGMLYDLNRDGALHDYKTFEAFKKKFTGRVLKDQEKKDNTPFIEFLNTVTDTFKDIADW